LHKCFVEYASKEARSSSSASTSLRDGRGFDSEEVSVILIEKAIE